MTCKCVRKPFQQFCTQLTDAILKLGKLLTSKLNAELLFIVQTVANKITDTASNPILKKFFKKLAESAAPQQTGRKAANIAKAVAGAATEEAAEHLTKFTQASRSARSALKCGILVDGVFLAYSVGTSYSKYQKNEISWEQHRKTVIKRTGAATGSVGAGALGSFVGTLVFPGVGSVIGGFVGGVAGD